MSPVSEVEVAGGWLRSTDRAGWVRYTRKAAADSIRRFRVTDRAGRDDQPPPDVSTPEELDKLAVIEAERNKGKPLWVAAAYPRHWLVPLAEALARLCHVASGEEVAPGVRRVLADNPGPFTFKGTVSYIVGRGRVAIIDPGPLDETHIAALLDAVRGETVTHIFVTHTHRDHSPAVPRIKAATGAIVLAEGPHRAARPPRKRGGVGRRGGVI